VELAYTSASNMLLSRMKIGAGEQEAARQYTNQVLEAVSRMTTEEYGNFLGCLAAVREGREQPSTFQSIRELQSRVGFERHEQAAERAIAAATLSESEMKAATGPSTLCMTTNETLNRSDEILQSLQALSASSPSRSLQGGSIQQQGTPLLQGTPLSIDGVLRCGFGTPQQQQGSPSRLNQASHPPPTAPSDAAESFGHREWAAGLSPAHRSPPRAGAPPPPGGVLHPPGGAPHPHGVTGGFFRERRRAASPPPGTLRRSVSPLRPGSSPPALPLPWPHPAFHHPVPTPTPMTSLAARHFTADGTGSSSASNGASLGGHTSTKNMSGGDINQHAGAANSGTADFQTRASYLSGLQSKLTAMEARYHM